MVSILAVIDPPPSSRLPLSKTMSVKDPNSPRTHSGTNPSSSVSFIHSEREREQWPRCSWNRGSPLKHQRLQATASNKTLNTRNSGLVEHNTNSEWKTVDLLGKPEREQKRLFSKWYSETSCDADRSVYFILIDDRDTKKKQTSPSSVIIQMVEVRFNGTGSRPSSLPLEKVNGFDWPMHIYQCKPR